MSQTKTLGNAVETATMIRDMVKGMLLLGLSEHNLKELFILGRTSTGSMPVETAWFAADAYTAAGFEVKVNEWEKFATLTVRLKS